MGRRIGQLAAGLAFILMIMRLGRLLQSGPEHPRWQLILLASAFLGGVAWWLIGQMTSNRVVRLSIFTAAGLLLAFRISTPETLVFGVLPSQETLGQMASQLDLAFGIIRSGVPPVIPHPGLLSILAGLMWAIGALYTWGNDDGPYAAMFVPSLIAYFQFAVFDRVEAGLGWLTASSLTLGVAILALALERREEAGRARDAEGRPVGRRSVGVATVMTAVLAMVSLGIADNAAALISEYGNAPWRGGGSGGYGSGSGGIEFNRLVDLRQRVISRSNTPVFVATLGPGAPPARDIYWRVETLDDFDGRQWRRSDTSLTQYQPGRPLADGTDIYAGTSSEFLQLVQIRSLVTDVAPTAGVPVEIQQPDTPNGRRPTDFHILSDAAIVTTSGLREDDTYTVLSVHPDRRADLGVLATGPDGNLTRMFQAAAEAGAFEFEPGAAATTARPPANLERFTSLPDNTPSNIVNVARARTAGATTDFEKAWMLQSWFRDSGAFTYSTDVDTGHDALSLEDWLTDRTSRNFRTGYCEQFAASMAVLARALDIPSRVVWGFTPGSVETQANGVDLVVVRDTNAHAWVELWLEPYGWVQFDPTPRSEQTGFDAQPESITAAVDPENFLPEPTQSDPDFVASNPADLEGLNEIGDPTEASPVASGTRWSLLLAPLVVVLLLAVPAAKRLRRRRRLGRIRNGDITAAWDEIVDRLTDLGGTIDESKTPVELAMATDRALVPLARTYSDAIYGGRRGAGKESDLLGAEWWIDRSYDAGRRFRATFSLRSLFKRR